MTVMPLALQSPDLLAYFSITVAPYQLVSCFSLLTAAMKFEWDHLSQCLILQTSRTYFLASSPQPKDRKPAGTTTKTSRAGGRASIQMPERPPAYKEQQAFLVNSTCKRNILCIKNCLKNLRNLTSQKVDFFLIINCCEISYK